MKYHQPKIESSFRKNNLGWTLYNAVLVMRPKKIIEFGAHFGYSSICMAMALKVLGQGHIYSYDTWSNINRWKSGSMEECRSNAIEYGVADLITYGTRDFNEWTREDFDLLYVDINNDGAIVRRLTELAKPNNYVMFEGGTTERDQVEWMEVEKREPIVGSCSFVVLDTNFPGISAL